MDVIDNTQTTDSAFRRNEENWDKALNTEAAVLGQPLGSRTSASEAQNVFSQALKPTLDKARYQGEQLFPWIAEMTMELWRQYSNPDTTITILRGPMPTEVKPAELWGSLKTRLTAIDKFEDDVTRRAEQNNFLQVGLPFLQPVIGNKGMAELFRQIMIDRDIVDDVDSIFPANNTFDAGHVAQSENQAIYFGGVEDTPTAEEDHETHLLDHRRFRAMIAVLPPDQIDKEALSRLDLHITIHEQMLEQSQTQGGAARELTPGAGQAAQVPGPTEQPAGPGEVSGDAIAGLQGGL
jgi:hypothetical protein